VGVIDIAADLAEALEPLFAGRPGRRRVLQIDYADFDLPEGLQWAGIG
jgi:hypothetical protein